MFVNYFLLKDLVFFKAIFVVKIKLIFIEKKLTSCFKNICCLNPLFTLRKCRNHFPNTKTKISTSSRIAYREYRDYVTL